MVHCGEQVSPVTFAFSKEKIKKTIKRETKIAKIMTKHDILVKKVMGGRTRSVNFVGVVSKILMT